MSIMGDDRRSFIKWGVKLGVATLVGVSILWNKTLDASAHVACPHNGDCDCGAGGKGPWSAGSGCSNSYNCNGHAGHYVPVTTVCIVFCCGTGGECEVYDYPNGMHLCSGGGC